MIQFYKPNAKNTGSACSFQYNEKDKAVWVNFVSQFSWNDQSKTGTFKKTPPEKRAYSKFSLTEIAGLVHAIETNGEYSNYHGDKERNTRFKFGPYLRDGNQIGYSFSLNQNNSKENVKKSFVIWFNFAEGRMLKEFGLTVLKNYFTDCIKTNTRRYAHINEAQQPSNPPLDSLLKPSENQQTATKVEEKVENALSNQDNTPEDDGIPW